MIYVSYHNLDLGLAFRLARLLIGCYREAWLDRFELAPDADWQAAIESAQARAGSAIAIISDEYLGSAYCRAEHNTLVERGISVTALVARDFNAEAMNDFTFSDWLDCRRFFDDPSDIQAEPLLSRFPQSDSAPQTGQRRDYLLRFIEDCSLALARMPSAWAAMRSGDAPHASPVRPRLLQTDLLRDWAFTATGQGPAQPVTDLNAWAAQEDRFIIRGEAGSGKTFFARMLALTQAHAALRDDDQALPIWLDMAACQDEARSLDDFMDSNWPLLSYWRHWAESQRGLFLLDDWGSFRVERPQLAAEFASWIESSDRHRFILLADRDCEISPALPSLSLPRPDAALAQKFAAAILTLEQQNSFRQILKRKGALIEDSPLAYLAIGMELLAADRALANKQWQADPLLAMLRLRGQMRPASRFGLTVAAALEGLEALAYAMTEADSQALPMPAARQACRDPRIIDYALAIGILVERASLPRFESQLMRCLLVARRLQRAGLAEILRPPAFDAAGARLPSQWRQPIMLLLDALDEQRRPQVAEQIAAIDPFLAGDALRRHPDDFDRLRESLLRQLLELCAQDEAARPAFRMALATYPQPERNAETLISLMSQHDEARQLWLWHEIASLPLEPPPDFLASLAECGHDPAAAASQLSARYPLAQCLAYLAAQSQGDDADLRLSAIHLLGELRYLPVAILLLAKLDDADEVGCDACLLALINFAYSEILARLLDWAQDQPDRHDALVAALRRGKRRVTSRLLEMNAARQLTLDANFNELAARTAETDIALGLALVAAEAIDLPADLKALAKAAAPGLRDRVADAIKHRPNKAAFQLLVEDVAATLEDPPEATVIAGSPLGALLYGEAALDAINAHAAEASETDDRLATIAGLASVRAAEALPLLLEASQDPEPMLRRAAYEALAAHCGELAAEKALVAGLADADAALVESLTGLLRGMSLQDYDAHLRVASQPQPAQRGGGHQHPGRVAARRSSPGAKPLA